MVEARSSNRRWANGDTLVVLTVRTCSTGWSHAIAAAQCVPCAVQRVVVKEMYDGYDALQHYLQSLPAADCVGPSWLSEVFEPVSFHVQSLMHTLGSTAVPSSLFLSLGVDLVRPKQLEELMSMCLHHECRFLCSHVTSTLRG